MGKPITIDVEIYSLTVYSLSFSLFEKVYFLNHGKYILLYIYTTK